MLKMCLANAMQVTDNNENIKLSKKKVSATRRIDLLAADINALVRLQPLREATIFADYVNSDEFGF
jgi:phage terminase large subunit-like protein